VCAHVKRDACVNALSLVENKIDRNSAVIQQCDRGEKSRIRSGTSITRLACGRGLGVVGSQNRLRYDEARDSHLRHHTRRRRRTCTSPMALSSILPLPLLRLLRRYLACSLQRSFSPLAVALWLSEALCTAALSPSLRYESAFPLLLPSPKRHSPSMASSLAVVSSMPRPLPPKAIHPHWLSRALSLFSLCRIHAHTHTHLEELFTTGGRWRVHVLRHRLLPLRLRCVCVCAGGRVSVCVKCACNNIREVFLYVYDLAGGKKRTKQKENGNLGMTSCLEL